MGCSPTKSKQNKNPKHMTDALKTYYTHNLVQYLNQQEKDEQEKPRNETINSPKYNKNNEQNTTFSFPQSQQAIKQGDIPSNKNIQQSQKNGNNTDTLNAQKKSDQSEGSGSLKNGTRIARRGPSIKELRNLISQNSQNNNNK